MCFRVDILLHDWKFVGPGHKENATSDEDILRDRLTEAMAVVRASSDASGSTHRARGGSRSPDVAVGPVHTTSFLTEVMSASRVSQAETLTLEYIRQHHGGVLVECGSGECVSERSLMLLCT